MAWLEDVFTAVLNMSVTAGIAILFILFLRFLLKKAPRKYIYLLWVVAAIRLVCPWTLSSEVSLFNLGLFQTANTDHQKLVWYQPGSVNQKKEDVAESGQVFRKQENADEPGLIIPEKESLEESGQAITAKENMVESGQAIQEKQGNFWVNSVLSIVWLAGVTVFLLNQMRLWILVKKRIKQAIRMEKNVYECDSCGSPFVLGIFSPKIYLPFGLTQDQKSMILLHERYHIRKKDHVVKLAAVIILAVYWFHPLVWAAFYYMTEDMEMRCDEAVVEQLGENIKTQYGECLLKLAVRDRGIAGTLAFGEAAVGKRIRNILNFRKKGRAAAILSIVICITAAAVLLTNRMGFPPALSYSGFYKAQGENPRLISHGMDYNLDKSTKSVAFYLELWNWGELEDYQLLDVRSIGNGENDFPQKGRIVAEEKYQYTEGMDSWIETSLYLEPDGGGAQQKITDTYQLKLEDTASFGERFRVDENHKNEDLPSEKDLVLAVYHVGFQDSNGNGIVYYFTCENLDNRRDGNYWDKEPGNTNSQELVYRMVLSEKTESQLREEYKVSPEVSKMSQAKTPYIGNAPAVMNVLSAVYMEEMGAYIIELNTEQEPYVLTIHFKEEPQQPELWNQKMKNKAALIFPLIGNLGQVAWDYPSKDGAQIYEEKLDSESAGKMTGIL